MVQDIGFGCFEHLGHFGDCDLGIVLEDAVHGDILQFLETLPYEFPDLFGLN